MTTVKDDLLSNSATGKDETPVLVVTALMTLIATVFIALRLYGCVFLLRRRLYLEEWLCVINQIDLWLTAAFVINLYTTTGVGLHWATLSDAERTKAVFWHNVLTAPSVLGLGLPKLTVVSLLTRVFRPGDLHQTILWVLAILCVGNFVVVILLAWLPCRPISAGWDVSITAKKCLDSWIYVRFCYYATTFSAALDLYFALYPGFVFRRLSWDIQKKLILSVVMGLGICATAVAAYKITTLEVLTFTKDFTCKILVFRAHMFCNAQFGCICSTNLADHVSTAIIPTVVEANTIMIAACISTLHPVYELVSTKFRRQTLVREGDGVQRRQSDVDDNRPGVKRGFWSMLMERDVWTEVTTVTQPSQNLSQRGPVPTSENEEMITRATRTLEDALDTQRPDQQLMREAGTDTAPV
ncbi:hypothetical protein N8I77_009590 [Diaporthe amygdali]|uniref:Rhodopsin domain-containing protein n=1 Tax=Phomopsis amygdali TaxID=1214568 RepID=A0AAD9W0M3_PHOAM|nr:hypothetical protein N8I77_009590 [Diaporthe amygdali]